MKTIIKITKQEAIIAFKEQHGWSNDKEITVEIEEDCKYYPPIIYSNKCLICGKELNNGMHICSGTYPYLPQTYC